MKETITVEKEVYEAVLRNSLRVCDLEKENEDLISRKNWCNARAKKILEKNKQLKQLLKECREYVVNTPVYPQGDDNKQAEIHRLVDKLKDDVIDGIWYIVVDSNQIPSITSGHGGFRASDNKLNFKQKLLKIQAYVMQSTMKMTMVTAFSYVEFIKFLMSIDINESCNYISKTLAPDFWTWSNKFIDNSFVTIRG